MKLLRALLLLLGMLLALQVQAARTAVPLDAGWRFLRADAAGAEAPAFDDSSWTAVTLPHSYNARDGEAGGAYYRGPGWYRRVLDVAPGTRRHFLEFDGATLAADVWVNGRHAGRHEGGYARFRFDITSLLQAGPNVLAVRVDNNALPHVAPLGGDFTIFGGLVRSVRLIETDGTHLELLDHGSSGVQVDTRVRASEARLSITAALRNDLATPAAHELWLTLRDAQGRIVARERQPARLAAMSASTASAELRVPSPHLWQGVHDPYLYRLSVELRKGGAVSDAVQLPIGLRQIAVDPQRGLLLNGKPYALHGVNYFHAGRPGRGVAVSDADIDEDLRILMELGVTGLRLVHYQHPPRVYERADELGLVLWTEIPLNAAMGETPAFRDNLFQQLRELVRQNRHHASVAIWGLGNEVYRSDEPIVTLLADLQRLAKQEDPTRLTAYAHCCAADDHPMALQTDLAAYNRYWGWYDGELSDIGPWADRLHEKLPTRPIGLGEYGAGGSVLQQEDPPRRPAPGARWHPEQYQALFHEAYARQLAARPFLWGHFVWLGFDHASAGRNEGDAPGFNDKGLVTYDRRWRKDAFRLLQAWWRDDPVLHLANRRATPRPAGSASIKAYSNSRQVSLEINGQAMGTVPVVDRVAEWPAVPLAAGRALLRVRDERGLTDTVEWTVRAPADSAAGPAVQLIELNQVGYLPGAAKWAAVPNVTANSFAVVDADTGREVWRGTLAPAQRWAPAQQDLRLADFSGLSLPGRYRLQVQGLPMSAPFNIATDAYAALNAAALKFFYFNRASIALDAAHAGVWARPAGHPDEHVLVHASAAGPGRPEGSVISAPKGWYDAGDYNKYIVNSGISTSTLLTAWEHFPAFFQTQRLNIPESGNGLPDVLNEALWNLEWMLAMQDPADGGVYHKLTDKGFDTIVMPHEARHPRYVVMKTTAAALDFAAVMAQASRVFASFEAHRPGLSSRMLAASRRAWDWALAHPDAIYRQPADVHTGGYDDSQLADEFAWAAAELYITTREDTFWRRLQRALPNDEVPSWSSVGALAWVSLAQHRDQLTPAADRALIEDRIRHAAAGLRDRWQRSPYRVAMQGEDFVWGSNAVALNQALMLIQGYRLSGERSMLDAAQSALDFVLGRHPTGYAMVTGFGTRSPQHPHHRPSGAMPQLPPVPGMIVGGPHPGRGDDCREPYPSQAPAKAYLDALCSYTTNEIAINWNAPLVYVSAALQALTPAKAPVKPPGD
ncbi:glycoside hydrolase family 9 protein [Burkholderiaceae bacterium UC74_6]